MPKYEAVDLPKKYEAVDIAQTTPTTPYRTAAGEDVQPPATILSKGEKIDAAIGGASALGATLATLPLSGPGAAGFGALARAATIRSLAAAAGGATGSVAGSAIQTALDTPGKPANTAEVINRALESGVTEGIGQGVGEAIGAVAPVLVRTGKALVQHAPKSIGGQRMLFARHGPTPPPGLWKP